jgi:hypothetical protein
MGQYPEYSSKMNYVWQNVALTLEKFALKLGIYMGAYSRYKEVKLNSLIGLGTVELLPSLPTNQYYSFKINAEFTAGLVAYDGDTEIFYGTELVDGITTTSATSLVSLISSDEEEVPFGENVTIQETGPITVGNGSLVLKIWYNVHKIG